MSIAVVIVVDDKGTIAVGQVPASTYQNLESARSVDEALITARSIIQGAAQPGRTTNGGIIDVMRDALNARASAAARQRGF